MSMETDFRALLAGDPAIAALVGTRIYPTTYAQATTDPAVRYTKVAGSSGIHMSGADGLSESAIQVDVRALDAEDVLDIRDAIVSKLHGFRGGQGETEFRLIILDSDRGITFDATGPKKYYSASLDFNVWSRAA